VTVTSPAAIAEAKRKIADKARRDVVWKAKHLFGFDAWSKQAEILRAVREHDRVCVVSSHGPGKTATAAQVVLDFLSSGPCRIITTAPTWAQVQDLLWAEIRSAHRRSVALGLGWPKSPNLTDWRLSDDWVALGLSTDVPERFQGHHAPRLLLVVDEASGVDEEIYNAGRGFLTGAGSKVLLVGNPTRLNGRFHRAAQDPRWRKIHISTLDCPAFTGERVPPHVAAALPSKAWLEEMASDLGADSAEYAVRVLGEFASLNGRPFWPAHRLAAFEPMAPSRVGRLVGTPAPGGRLQFEADASGPLQLWDVPRTGHRYAMFADVAGEVTLDQSEARPKGLRDDACAAYVVDLETGVEVAALHGRFDLDEYAFFLAQLGRLYADAVLAVEMNGSGQAVLVALKNLYAYPNLYQRRELDTQSGRWHQRLGWATTSASRPVMLAGLTETLRDAPERLRDEALLDEMRTFIRNDRDKPIADVGCHDDRVMARAGVCEVFREYAQTPIRLKPRKPQPAPLSAAKRAARAA
jgi:hypothetical protein